MKKFIGLLAVLCIQAPFVQTALAQDVKTALVPLPSIDDFTKGNDGFSFGLGLGVEYETAYEGSQHNGAEAMTLSTLRARRWGGVVCVRTRGCSMPPSRSMKGVKKVTRMMVA